MSIPEVVEQAPNKGKIISFEELQTFGPEVRLEHISEVVKAAFNVKPNQFPYEKFDSITFLRALNKHYPNDVRDIFKQFGDEILKSIGSEFVLIQRHILIFILEVLTTPREVPLDQIIVSKLIPLLLDRATSRHKEVKTPAKESLKYITISLTCNESLLAFAAETIPNPKKRLYNQYAFEALAHSIRGLGPNVCNVDDRSLKGIFVSLAKTMHARYHQGVFDLARELLNHMCGLMGFDNMVRLLKSLIDENSIMNAEANTLVEEIATRNSQNFKEKSNNFRQMVQSTKNNAPRDLQDMPVEILFDKRTEACLAQQSQMQNNGVSMAAGPGAAGFGNPGMQQWH